MASVNKLRDRVLSPSLTLGFCDRPLLVKTLPQAAGIFGRFFRRWLRAHIDRWPDTAVAPFVLFHLENNKKGISFDLHQLDSSLLVAGGIKCQKKTESVRCHFHSGRWWRCGSNWALRTAQTVQHLHRHCQWMRGLQSLAQALAGRIHQPSFTISLSSDGNAATRRRTSHDTVPIR